MKLKTLLLTALGVVSFQSSATNEQTFSWYASGGGNAMYITTTVGCIGSSIMYERHAVRANTGGTWNFADFDYHFKLFSYGVNNDPRNILSFNTSKLHNEDGTLNTAPLMLFTTRSYTKLDGIKNKSGDINYPGWVIDTANFPVDPQCNLVPDPWPPKFDFPLS